MSPFRRLGIILLAFVAAGLTACSLAESAPTPTLRPTAVLLGYQTPTPSQTPAAAAVPEDLPTATPATYTVVAGDTFFTIAARLDIDLQLLMAANPGVDPRLISPGTVLTLPVAGGTAVPSVPSPTPVPIVFGDVECYVSIAAELWCFLPVSNTLETPVENISALIHLLAADGRILASLEATPPLNLLGVDGSMALVAYTDDPPAGWVSARAEILSAYSLNAESDYYLTAVLQGPSIDISEDGLSARAVGRLEIQAGEAEIIWVLAVAYDESGGVVGVRRWESAGETEFDFRVYSLGPRIADVELLVEAR